MAFEFVANTYEMQDILTEIFTDDFMQKYTKFDSFTIFKYSSAVFVNWNAANLYYNADNMNHFVKESTDFESWDEMVRTAANEKYQL